ncbi:anhydro-N-acetylmuramic acid kinase [Winogradskyella sp. DF17]|uniref:Anhydro-N-acetylmuramic acid kinase n=1 Tax=Winogradskyella pelagia TaxID=2819984 RepID=A0ABS3T3J2_9FLAO|nr:anhydro-N-acetylmuramic acid kinase [Winogradskyella sp. DF17]MBO3117316.1 anhydro-N-acetylmuramic acid kinase [Winogradskyella sp. DF17]
MTKTSFNVIGVMSGTSLDGIDLAFCTFNKSEKWEFKIHCAETVSYDGRWLKLLRNALNLNTDELQLLDLEYSQFLGKIVDAFILKNKISNIDFVASHGHTVLHRPDLGYTYQIGNRQELADQCKIKVICDFRVEDVELGGQGAPLVPIGDKLLFDTYDYCVNLGGFANVSYDMLGERLAFDICPANLVLNHFMSVFNLDFDNRGQLAASGCVDENLLEELNAISYYSVLPPKSLGLEWVQDVFFPVIKGYDISTKDVLRTLVEHIAYQISRVIKEENTKTLVTGGGAFNDFLISRIEARSKSKVILPQPKLIEFKEALIFAFLAVLRERNEVNCLKSVTGATRNHSSGKVFQPNFKINN